MAAATATAPPTLHVVPRVDSATIYKDKSRLRRCAPLSFAAAVEEVQVMVPMPAGRGPQSAFDRDSIQVEFGAAYDGKVVLAGVLVDEVDKACLRSDGTVDVDAARRLGRAGVVSVSDSDADDVAAAKSSAEARREVEVQLASVRLKLRLNEIALDEATAARDFSVDVAKRAVDCEGGAALATAGVMFDAEMWAAHVDAVEAAKRDFARRRRELQHEREALEKEVTVLESKLPSRSVHDWERSGAEDSTTVVVAVLTLKVLAAVPASPEAVVYVSYMVQRGAWDAVYEAHLDTATNEVVLYYNAEVRMSDGEDLHEVALTLSSAAPRRNAALPPTMTIWRCGVVQPPPPEEPADEACCYAMMEADSAPRGLMLMAAPAPMMRRMDAAVEQVGTGGVVNFAIPTPQTVLANGKTTRVPLTELRMPAKISYVSVPEKLPAAFTHAKIRNTSDFLLLTGDVAVFLDGNYVTRSRLGAECASGGMVELDFGVDRAVEVKRVLLRQANRKVQSSYLKGTKNNVKTYAYKITIRNKKRASGDDKGAVKVKLIEHMPVSSEEQLRVRLVSPSKPQEEVYIYDDAADRQEQLQRKARALENDGVVEMEREVRAGESVDVLFSFEVESPSTATVYGL
ncbi:putative mitochondrial hypothetical protein [Leptomonas pyrrhocoris]|uniref:DUF4139 domain-containing protein n=1 Tax=Leptomonas pyrrhocoris TaxID=157538 RepID=A0A0M9G1S9_LEPPY|nr:putative mitochondrial hypothetical protein [Leptomonas pyrrhocoris]KPA80605.1 putative mitochondrial hypothetical protein [Leptomonas pyrrhocoris]|eukprot:XP_015659044.1 putative mitochondrial hypothetical protein [Leptomonas pyrrhocoris]